MQFCYTHRRVRGARVGMAERKRLIVDAAYVAWEAGDVPALMNCFSDDITFAVYPRDKPSFLGRGRGKTLLENRIHAFRAQYTVLDYSAATTGLIDDWVPGRVTYHYRHKASGLEIDGSMRHYFRVCGDKIVALDVVHDGWRMGAFFQLTAYIATALT
jgi:ketosteroid isomerase-like protein